MSRGSTAAGFSKCSPGETEFQSNDMTLLLPENCWNPGRLSEISLDDFYDSMPIMTSGTDGTPLPWRMTL